MNEKNGVGEHKRTGKPSANNAVKEPSRGKFLGRKQAEDLTNWRGAWQNRFYLLLSRNDRDDLPGDGIGGPGPRANPRVRRCFAIRLETANEQARIPVPPTRPTAATSATADKCGTDKQRHSPGWYRLG